MQTTNIVNYAFEVLNIDTFDSRGKAGLAQSLFSTPSVDPALPVLAPNVGA